MCMFWNGPNGFSRHVSPPPKAASTLEVAFFPSLVFWLRVDCSMLSVAWAHRAVADETGEASGVCFLVSASLLPRIPGAVDLAFVPW